MDCFTDRYLSPHDPTVITQLNEGLTLASNTRLWRKPDTSFTFKDWGEEEVIVFHHSALSTHLVTRSSFSVLQILVDASAPMTISDLAHYLSKGLPDMGTEDGLLAVLEHILIEFEKLHLVESASN